MAYRICVYAISKDEERFADRWMDAVSEADLVVVLDTGSADRTVEKLRARGALVYEARISPWRFDAARNVAMDHIPKNVDICVSNDLDEVFEPGWRRALEAAWLPGHTRARYRFVSSHRADGTPQTCFDMEKIHRRHGFRWVHPVHEVLEYTGADPDSTVWVEGLVLHHHPDRSKPRGQYLPLLELSASENPQDAQTAFWLGREYFYYGRRARCVEALTRYLSLPAARWEEERSAAMCLLGRCLEQDGNAAEAMTWLLRAVAECPGVREPYLALVKAAYRAENWPLAYAMAEKGLSVTRRGGSYLVQPESWGAALYDYGAIAAYRLGLYEAARAYAAEACAHSPDDGRLQANLRLIERKLAALEAKGAPPCED